MSGWWNKTSQVLQNVWSGYNSDRAWALLLAVAAAAAAVALFALSRTKWGKAKPLVKCVVFSVVAHVWLLMYAYGTKLNGPGSPNGSLNTAERLFMVAESESDQPMPEAPNSDDSSSSIDAELAAQLDTIEPLPAWQPADLESPPVPFDSSPLADLSGLTSLDHEVPELDFKPDNTQTTTAVNAALAAAVDTSLDSLPLPHRPFDDKALPQEYLLRNNPQKLQYAQQFGASQQSEEAVARGLRWLASSQLPDGSWNAVATGAGRETRTVGSTVYQGIGRNADTGITGLALLAFLSAGHTHVQGEYATQVRKGLEFLVSQQMVSGDLSGRRQQSNLPADLFSRMYCHGIAAFALGEAYAMTGDPSLVQPVTLAAGFTIKCQDPTTGGWRYVAQDKGDLSQFGWQALALRSTHHGGIEIPRNTWDQMQRFLQSVSGGKSGGLGKYREQESPTTTMTAEKLACHLLLDQPMSDEAETEARQELLSHLPGSGEDNVYYWYYGTLAMFQYQDQAWKDWNQALQTRLLALQEPDQSYLSGSWPPDAVWGGYGGRVYNTAMSCLCLEVYYRYLPLYKRSNLAQTPGASGEFQR